MKKFFLIKIMVLLGLMLFFNTSLYTKSNEIVIFGNNSRPPKIWLEGNKPSGILVDILRLLEDDLDVKFDVQLYPWARTFHLAERRQGGIIGFSKNPERLEVYDYSDLIYNAEVLIVVKKGNEFKFEKIEDLKGKNIVVQRGATYGSVYENAKNYFIPEETAGNQMNGLRMVYNGRADAILINPGISALNQLLSDTSLIDIKDEFSVLEKPLVVDPNYLAFRKELNMKNFLNKFNAALKVRIEKGEIQRIIDMY